MEAQKIQKVEKNYGIKVVHDFGFSNGGQNIIENFKNINPRCSIIKTKNTNSQKVKYYTWNRDTDNSKIRRIDKKIAKRFLC